MADIIESDDYESPALFWLYRDIKRLDRTLLAAGIADQPTRRRICEEYFFDVQDALSTAVAAGPHGEFTPLLVFLDGDGQHLRATDQFDFHEYAHAIVAEYYEHPHPA